ncbi:MAG: PIG-L deacetylase family protein, partial [Candidatus Methylumidiphilus sp.]
MLDESSYLPFTPAKLPPSPWLVISPHPDDETFGLGGTLLLATEQGIAIDVLFLTSGDKGGAGDIAAIREREALEATRLLGVRDVSFWHLPDRLLSPCQSVIGRLAEMILATKPACIFFPSPVEPHPDHRASSVIAWEALRKTGFTAEPWSYEISV